MDAAITFVAKYCIALPVLVALYVFIVLPGSRRRLKFALVVVLGGIISYILAKLGSHVYYDTRPFVQGHFTPLVSHAADNGFPSDHTLLAALLGWAILAFRRNIGIATLCLAAVIGASRMAAGVHHLADIVGSFVFAGIGCWLAVLLVRRLAAAKAKRAPGRE